MNSRQTFLLLGVVGVGFALWNAARQKDRDAQLLAAVLRGQGPGNNTPPAYANDSNTFVGPIDQPGWQGPVNTGQDNVYVGYDPGMTVEPPIDLGPVDPNEFFGF